ncbi:MAG: hypothetical protein PHE51_12815 [Eubacteriales bacterium]|nr:hypothetical protein [Eubacteriales bacterium]
MITDKQFEDAFTAAGGWFFLTQFELIKAWAGSKTELVEMIYSKGFDAKRTGSNTRVSSSIRIIDAGRGKEALIKIRDSKYINREHPEAEHMASELLSKYFG